MKTGGLRLEKLVLLPKIQGGLSLIPLFAEIWMGHLRDFLSAGYGTILLMVVLVGAGIAATLLASILLGPKRQGPIKSIPYESGIDPLGNARQPFHIRYYLVAIIFLIFDVEVIFFYPWAVMFRQARAGAVSLDLTMGYYLAGILIFTLILLVAFVYEWARGGLEWQ